MLCPSLFGLSVKVLLVDHKRGEVILLMPMHNTRILAELPPEEPEIRVRAKQFYRARIEPGNVDTVILLMPMHNTRILAELPPEEPEIRVRAKQFYRARIEPGNVDTVKRNILRVEIPGRPPVRIRKISFLD